MAVEEWCPWHESVGSSVEYRVKTASSLFLQALTGSFSMVQNSGKCRPVFVARLFALVLLF